MTLADNERRRVGVLLGIGILLAPLIFVWALLRRGHSTASRVVGFGWLALIVVIVIAASGGSEEAQTADAPPEPQPLAEAQVVEKPLLESTYFVSVSEAIVRTAPDGEEINRFYRSQRVEVSETRGAWVRVTALEMEPRWMRLADLSRQRPAELPQPKLPPGLDDARMSGIPKVGEYGHDEADVLVLRQAAAELLAGGECKKIEDASKSVNAKGLYYLNCGEPQNRFFRMEQGKPYFCGRTWDAC